MKFIAKLDEPNATHLGMAPGGDLVDTRPAPAPMGRVWGLIFLNGAGMEVSFKPVMGKWVGMDIILKPAPSPPGSPV